MLPFGYSEDIGAILRGLVVRATSRVRIRDGGGDTAELRSVCRDWRLKAAEHGTRQLRVLRAKDRPNALAMDVACRYSRLTRSGDALYRKGHQSRRAPSSEATRVRAAVHRLLACSRSLFSLLVTALFVHEAVLYTPYVDRARRAGRGRCASPETLCWSRLIPVGPI